MDASSERNKKAAKELQSWRDGQVGPVVESNLGAKLLILPEELKKAAKELEC